MIRSLFKWYVSTSLLLRIFAGFLIGSAIGGVTWYISSSSGTPIADNVLPYISPFGSVLISMLKMIVIPVIFFSLITGAASLPIKRFGRIGIKVIAWYFFCSALAAIVGAALALYINRAAVLIYRVGQKWVNSLERRLKASQ